MSFVGAEAFQERRVRKGSVGTGRVRVSGSQAAVVVCSGAEELADITVAVEERMAWEIRLEGVVYQTLEVGHGFAVPFTRARWQDLVEGGQSGRREWSPAAGMSPDVGTDRGGYVAQDELQVSSFHQVGYLPLLSFQ